MLVLVCTPYLYFLGLAGLVELYAPSVSCHSSRWHAVVFCLFTTAARDSYRLPPLRHWVYPVAATAPRRVGSSVPNPALTPLLGSVHFPVA